MIDNTVYVLLATFDPDPDEVPHEVWVFPTQAAAEKFLRGWSEDFLGGYSHDVDDLPPDDELVAAFRAMGAHVHLYQCPLTIGSSEELVLFERGPQVAHQVGTA